MPASPNLQQNHFQLFDLPERFRLDSEQLTRSFLALQAQVHPDKFAHLPETDRRLAAQWAMRVNEARDVLRDPVARARYLLALRGVDTQEETNTAMAADFLMQQMEWRESVAEAARDGDFDRLEQIKSRLNADRRALQEQLAAALDDERNDALAAESVRKLRFLEKLAADIDAAFDEMDELS
jgi:molecular chaperone HscB